MNILLALICGILAILLCFPEIEQTYPGIVGDPLRAGVALLLVKAMFDWLDEK